MTQRNVAVIQDAVTITLSTLGALTAITGSGKIDASRLQGARLKKMRANISFVGKTTGEGPLLVGYTIEATTSETSAALAADPQFNADPTGIQNKFKVVPLWVIPKNGTASENIVSTDQMRLHDMDIPYRDIIEGSQLNWFVFNQDSGALTGGTIVDISVVTVAEWMRD